MTFQFKHAFDTNRIRRTEEDHGVGAESNDDGFFGERCNGFNEFWKLCWMVWAVRLTWESSNFVYSVERGSKTHHLFRRKEISETVQNLKGLTLKYRKQCRIPANKTSIDQINKQGNKHDNKQIDKQGRLKYFKFWKGIRKTTKFIKSIGTKFPSSTRDTHLSLSFLTVKSRVWCSYDFWRSFSLDFFVETKTISGLLIIPVKVSSNGAGSDTKNDMRRIQEETELVKLVYPDLAQIDGRRVHVRFTTDIEVVFTLPEGYPERFVSYFDRNSQFFSDAPQSTASSFLHP